MSVQSVLKVFSLLAIVVFGACVPEGLEVVSDLSEDSAVVPASVEDGETGDPVAVEEPQATEGQGDSSAAEEVLLGTGAGNPSSGSYLVTGTVSSVDDGQDGDDTDDPDAQTITVALQFTNPEGSVYSVEVAAGASFEIELPSDQYEVAIIPKPGARMQPVYFPIKNNFVGAWALLDLQMLPEHLQQRPEVNIGLIRRGVRGFTAAKMPDLLDGSLVDFDYDGRLDVMQGADPANMLKVCSFRYLSAYEGAVLYVNEKGRSFIFLSFMMAAERLVPQAIAVAGVGDDVPLPRISKVEMMANSGPSATITLEGMKPGAEYDLDIAPGALGCKDGSTSAETITTRFHTSGIGKEY